VVVVFGVDHEADGRADDERTGLDPDAERFPPFITSTAEQKRWRLCVAISESIFDDEPNRWAATRSLYRSSIDT
jgi:hypothetical protein